VPALLPLLRFEGDRRETGGAGVSLKFARRFSERGEGVAWILRLVKTSTDGEGSGTDLMEIRRPVGIGDIANLGLTLSEAKLLLASVQREIATAQASDHVVRRPKCQRREGVCRLKDYRDHAVATLFGQVTMKLPRFRCAGCGRNRDWHRLAITLPIDIGTGPASGAPFGPDDLPGSR
jgi:hypothetical protein